jgi:HD-like signal output (HDOD) protein
MKNSRIPEKNNAFHKNFLNGQTIYHDTILQHRCSARQVAPAHCAVRDQSHRGDSFMTSAQTLIKKFKKIRTLPHIIVQMAQVINDDKSTLRDFEEVIQQDPALVTRLLALVNSPSFGLTRRIDSISRAVVLLGTKHLHSIATTDAIQHMLRSCSGSSAFSPHHLWLHSVASGICCKMIAERIFTLSGDDVYLCGILHDIGLIIIMEADPEAFLRIIGQLQPGGPSVIHLERKLFRTDHCEIGYILAKDWCLPDTIAATIRNHHPDEAGDIAPHSPDGILQMSEYIIQQLQYATIKNDLAVRLAPSLSAHIQKNIAEYKVLAEDFPEELEKTKNMYGS